MSFIKLPTSVKPSQITVELVRSDQIFMSPVTMAQQVASRGNTAWKWSVSYMGLSDSERDIVQAFLMSCKGSVNTFKMTYPGNYELRAALSDWTDVFSGRGSFVSDPGSADGKVNSYFYQASPNVYASHITEFGTVEQEVLDASTDRIAVGWGTAGWINNMEVGKAYAQRIKFFPGEAADSEFSLRCGSVSYELGSMPTTNAASAGVITCPFVANVSSARAQGVFWRNGSKNGTRYEIADYRLAQCGLVANSENLLTYSNNFGHADWTKNNANVASGYSNYSPTGVQSGAWKLYCDTASSTHQILQNPTTANTPDVFTFSVYARAAEIGYMQLIVLQGASSSRATFWLNSGTVSGLSDGSGAMRGIARIYDVGSSWYRCSISGALTANASTYGYIRLQNGGFNGNGSDGIEIAHASLVNFPFPGQYIETTTASLVGSYAKGSSFIVEGFDPGDIIKAGQHFEVVNRFTDTNSSFNERSEFKRVTKETRVGREGWARIHFDPPLRNAPIPQRSKVVGNAPGETVFCPVIFSDPEIKGRLLNGTIRYTDKPLKQTDIDFEIIEDLSE